jgi:pimeloyl-ACP methyl ester carboxylesterase
MSAGDGAQALPTIAYPLGVCGLVIRVLECGEGSENIVLLHGAGSRADRWSRNLPGLAAAGKHVYALDVPGHGFATKVPESDYSTPGFAAVVGEALHQLAIERPTLVGTSLGGHVAAYLAVRSEIQVNALDLVGTIGIVPVEREVAGSADRVTDSSYEGVAAKLKFLLHDPQLVTAPFVREERWVNSSPGAQIALKKTGDYVDHRSNLHLVGDELRSAAMPVILVWGENDRWVDPAVGHRIKSEVLPNAPLVLLRRAGHAPYYERPDDFNECLLAFLDNPQKYGSASIAI